MDTRISPGTPGDIGSGGDFVRAEILAVAGREGPWEVQVIILALITFLSPCWDDLKK